MKSLKIAKMNIKGVRRPATIFYTIFLAIMIATIISSILTDGSLSMSGVESATVIFLFVFGLNSFKTNFYFAKSNNISRKTFIKGIILSSAPIALAMSLIDVIINRISNVFIENPTFYDMAYDNLYRATNYQWGSNWVQSNAFGDVFNTILFHFSVCIIAYMLGLVINMIYYRSNKIMKVIVSAGPIALLIFLSNASNTTIFANRFYEKLGNFMAYIFGIDPLNVYAAVITFLVITVLLAGMSFLLVRKAVIKES